MNALRTLIVVDDDDDSSAAMAEALAGPDRVVRVFGDPGRALAAIGVASPDVLITDLAMPWFDGRDLVTRARQARPDMAVLIVSGLPGAPAWAHGRGLPCLEKPVAAARLQKLVEQLLAR